MSLELWREQWRLMMLLLRSEVCIGTSPLLLSLTRDHNLKKRFHKCTVNCLSRTHNKYLMPRPLPMLHNLLRQWHTLRKVPFSILFSQSLVFTEIFSLFLQPRDTGNPSAINKIVLSLETQLWFRVSNVNLTHGLAEAQIVANVVFGWATSLHYLTL